MAEMDEAAIAIYFARGEKVFLGATIHYRVGQGA
jgi:hypothetical protein